MKIRFPLRAAAVALACAAAAGGATAQSSVTVFGVVDAAARRASSDAGHVTSLVSGAYSSARWGIRGQEDLGGGLRAGFWLESFLSADTGTTTPVGFQRRSTLSLSHDQWGEIRLGRDYSPTHQNWARFDPFGYVGIGSVQLLILSATGTTPATAAFGSNPNTIQRVNNAVQYILPRNAWSVEGLLMWAPGEGGLSANDQHKAVGGRLGITLGEGFVQVSSLNTRDNGVAANFEDSGVAGSYRTPWALLSGGLRRLKFQSLSQDNWLLGAVVPLGTHEFKASWNRATMKGRAGSVTVDGSRSDQFALGWVDHLSKRTRLYATVARLTNVGHASFVLPGAPKAAREGTASRAAELGVNHEF